VNPGIMTTLEEHTKIQFFATQEIAVDLQLENLKTPNPNDAIQEYLQQRFSGKCMDGGFVLPGEDTIQILTRSPLVLNSLFGDSSHRTYVRFKANVIDCPPNTSINVLITHITPSRIICEYHMKDYGDISPIRVVFPTNLHTKDEREILKTLKKGMMIKGLITHREYSLGDSQIIAIGRFQEIVSTSSLSES
jgi:hypothetical protein